MVATILLPYLIFLSCFRCNWTIEAIDEFGNSDPNSALVIEAFSAPDVACDDGYFMLFDGKSQPMNIAH